MFSSKRITTSHLSRKITGVEFEFYFQHFYCGPEGETAVDAGFGGEEDFNFVNVWMMSDAGKSPTAEIRIPFSSRK